jgi:alpha-beta hydrolase superfamily lysophospholipase
MSDDDCSFETSELVSAGERLYRRTAKPAGSAWARLLIIHGYGEHSGRYAHFMRWIAGAGIASEAIDLRGHGLSTGRRGFVGQWDEYLEDVRAFLNAPRDVSLPTFILGHSHGGLITAAEEERGLLTAGADRMVGCILCSPYLTSGTHPARWKLILAHGANHLMPWLRVATGLQSEWLSGDAAMIAEDRADVLMNRTATPRWYLTMLQSQAVVKKEAARFKLPMLCLTGGNDVVADPNVTRIFFDEAGSSDKSLYDYPGRVHELLRDIGREKVFQDITGWIKVRSANA